MILPEARPALPPDPFADRRTDDRRRSAVERMVHALVRELLAALRAEGADAAAALDTETVDRIVAHLAITDRALIQLLGLTADLHAAARRLRTRADMQVALGSAIPGGGGLRLDDPETSAAFALYRRHEGARLDRFGDPVVTLDQLGSEGAAALGWTMVAALRRASGAPIADDIVSTIVAAILQRLSGRDAAGNAAVAVAREAGRAKSDRTALAVAAIEAGWLTLGAAFLADLLALDPGIVTHVVLAGAGMPVAAIARAAAPDDPARAAALLLAIARARHDDDDDAGEAAAAFLAGYATLSPDDAGRHIAALRAPRAYRDAAIAFGLDA